MGALSGRCLPAARTPPAPREDFSGWTVAGCSTGAAVPGGCRGGGRGVAGRGGAGWVLRCRAADCRRAAWGRCPPGRCLAVRESARSVLGVSVRSTLADLHVALSGGEGKKRLPNARSATPTENDRWLTAAEVIRHSHDPHARRLERRLAGRLASQSNVVRTNSGVGVEQCGPATRSVPLAVLILRPDSGTATNVGEVLDTPRSPSDILGEVLDTKPAESGPADAG
jgi:hypothetical protein